MPAQEVQQPTSAQQMAAAPATETRVSSEQPVSLPLTSSFLISKSVD